MGLMGLMALMSCSSDNDETEKASTIAVTGYVSAFGETEETRAWNPPTTPVAFERYDGTDKVIGAFFTQDGQTPKSGYFFYSSGQWHTDIDNLTAGNYYLYGYTPHSAGFTCSITDLNGNDSEYSEGAIMTFSNVPAVSPNDLCVVVGAKNGKTDYKAATDYSVTGLKLGNFAYMAEAIGGGGQNYVYLLFDHLYAAMRVRMRVQGEYAALRTIKLKELRLSTISEEGSMKNKTNITVTLRATDNSDPISSVVFTQTGNEESDGKVFESENGFGLTTDYQTFQGHFMPMGVSELIVTSKYDVYDNDSEGHARNLVRQDCIATNTVVLKNMFSEQMTALRGRRYTVNMTIQPTYLYVLSDPDLNSPTVTMD